ncbi:MULTISPECIES: DUF4296 domain-containing protein [Tenacibaculum]|uniref:DUF4296 domain-containing protein n=1 Tax=Tenacibaculum TaxID=104267 RepID=UPI001F0A62C4|nr:MULTISPECIES: DUF4296 domain-containing protein [Tenacibaculum]MCH3881249.1 DUF4296 domain-containing protein [Tenacibaculum aquimarinum]MDO6599157.1 DUF4296 domain-containing protein [Tenacibaculum sp. 1_MG-2023]
MKKVLYILVFIFLSSCTSNTIYKKPENLIPKDTMVALLSDMYIALSAKNVKNKIQQRQVNYLPFIYDKYKIDSARFKESNVYYTSVIEQYNEILLEVKDNIDKEHKKYSKELKTQDSIKNLNNKKIKKERLKGKSKEEKLNNLTKLDTTQLKKPILEKGFKKR